MVEEGGGGLVTRSHWVCGLAAEGRFGWLLLFRLTSSSPSPCSVCVCVCVCVWGGGSVLAYKAIIHTHTHTHTPAGGGVKRCGSPLSVSPAKNQKRLKLDKPLSGSEATAEIIMPTPHHLTPFQTDAELSSEDIVKVREWSGGEMG